MSREETGMRLQEARDLAIGLLLVGMDYSDVLFCAIAAAVFFWIAATTSLPFETVGFALLGALAALGALEHIFFASPLPDAALWRWLLPSRDAARARRL